MASVLNRILVLGMLFSVAAIATSEPAWALDETERSLLWQQPYNKSAGGKRVVTNVDRGFDEDPIDDRKLFRFQRRQLGKFNTAIWAAGVKGKRLDKKLFWDPKAYTGLAVEPQKRRKRYERAVSEYQFSSAVQLFGDEVGILNVPASVNFPLGRQSWAGSGIAFREPLENVWSAPGQGLAYSVDIQIPSMSGFKHNSTARFIPYSNISPQLLDNTTGTRIWLVTQLYDSRGFTGFDGFVNPEGVGGIAVDCPDGSCNKVIIATSFLPGMNYVTFDDETSERASKATWTGYRHFEVAMMYDQLQQALLDAEAAGAVLSTDPADYSIVEYWLANEIHVSLTPAAIGSHMGLSFKNLRLEQVTYE